MEWVKAAMSWRFGWVLFDLMAFMILVLISCFIVGVGCLLDWINRKRNGSDQYG